MKKLSFFILPLIFVAQANAQTVLPNGVVLPSTIKMTYINPQTLSGTTQQTTTTPAAVSVQPASAPSAASDATNPNNATSANKDGKAPQNNVKENVPAPASSPVAKAPVVAEKRIGQTLDIKPNVYKTDIQGFNNTTIEEFEDSSDKKTAKEYQEFLRMR